MSGTANASSEHRSRSRTRRIILAVLGLPVALLLIVAAVDVGYGMTDPVTEGSSSSEVWVCDPARVLPDCASGPDARLYPGARFQYLREIRNRGSAPITILGLDLPDYGAFEWLPTATIPEDHRYLMGPDDVVDFTPVALAPGEELPFVIRGRIRDCAPPMAEGGNMIVDSLRVRYRLLAVEHADLVETEGRFLVPFNPCPEGD